ncbi:transposase, partial [Mesorhizobium sp. M1A.F.Ca.IN.020.03.2.1]|uniref:transposase n=1 Tax=Mesorhizobium sp. M1A.F.Ca.IN.020.03.2.1 TaxID=2496769 RepID=UPI001FE0EFCA
HAVVWVVRLGANLPNNQLNVTGVDHWAWRRNHRYGTIVYNLERRRALTLLPDCEIATVEAWIADHPEIKIVLSDRGGGYGVVTKALPQASQVAAHCHLDAEIDARDSHGHGHHRGQWKSCAMRCEPSARGAATMPANGKLRQRHLTSCCHE